MPKLFLEYQFAVSPLQPASEILIAQLAELGFESFEETDTGILAYIAKGEGQPERVGDLQVITHPEFQITFSIKEIEQENWNETWEKEFQPIIVDKRCTVRAPFHPKPETQFDIIIEPKMSFGTGHHQTTHMMIRFLLKTDVTDKSVLDMGCGTGVLAILAAMKGAKYIEAIDIEEWAYLNTIENIERNGQSQIHVAQGDAGLLNGKAFDVILANINRNILIRDIPLYAKCLQNLGAILILSGFYQNDLIMVNKKCEEFGLRLEEKLEKDNWISAKYVF